jgi:uncharacterized membrane protein
MLEWFARRYELLKRLSPLISLTIQSLTLSTLIFSLTVWRGYGYWIIPVIFTAIITASSFIAWVYYVPLNMRRHERLAQMELNPIESDILLSPKEAWAWGLMADLITERITLQEYHERLESHILRRGRQ